MSRRLTYALLALIVAGCLVTGVLYALYTPPWQSPDEPAHYNYIAQVASSGRCCPVIAPGDWDSEYLEQLKADGFPDDADISPIQYEDHQPPAFYLIAAPVFAFSGGSLLAIRLLSVVIGAGVVVVTFLVVQRLFPDRPVLALAAAMFSAFLPQHLAMIASANNDAFSELVLGVALISALSYIGLPKETHRNRDGATLLGVRIGLCFLTKATIYLPAGFLLLGALVARWRLEKQNARWLAWETVKAGGVAGALGLVWWVRNITVYGFPDVMGLQRHDQVVVGQLRTSTLIGERGMGQYLADYVTTTYHSFFGQFGWMGVPMPPHFYLGIGLFLLAALAGVILLAVRFRSDLDLNAQRGAGLWLLVLVALTTLANLVYYNFTFVQFQGRYLFPALIPFALLIAVGLWGLARQITAWVKPLEKVSTWLPLVGLLWTPLLALWALFRFIVPNLK
jgi:4-amino-4-deoxy-L-arabinose transferase-like glycosyltransferase